ncbi:hypothetical protein HK102_000230 [Quaeritorhiza haematococci]|nr:hypothetical protein HK102_000230 [Quaeritorhiza haematococci]
MQRGNVPNDDAKPRPPCKRCRQLRKQIDILSGSNAAILAASQSLETEKNDLQRQLEAKDRIINHMEGVHAERDVNVKQVLEIQNRFLEANKRLLEEKVKSLEAQLNEARRMDEGHQVTIQSLRQRAVQLEDKVEALHGKNEAAGTRVTELVMLVQDYEKETARLREYTGQVESLQSEVEDVRSRLESEKASNAREVQFLVAEKAHLDVWNKSLRGELSAKEKRVQELEMNVTPLRRALSQKENRVQELEMEVMPLRRALSWEEKRVQELERELTPLRRASEIAHEYAVRCESLRDELEDLRSRLEKQKPTSQRDMKSLAAEKRHLEVWIKSLQKELEDAQAKEEENRRIASEAEASGAELKNQISLLEAHLAKRNAIAEKQSEEIVALVADNETLSEQIRSLRERQESYDKSLLEGEAAKVALKLLNIRVTSLEGLLKAAETRVSEKDREITFLTSTDPNEAIQKLRMEWTSHKRDIAESEKTKRAITIKINSLESSLVASNAIEEQVRNLHRQTAFHHRDGTEANASFQTQIKTLEASLAAAEAATEAQRREMTVLTASNGTLTEQLQRICTQQQQTHHHSQTTPKSPHENTVQTRKIKSLRKSLKDERRMSEYQKKTIRAKYRHILALKTAKVELERRVESVESQIVAMRADFVRQQQEYVSKTAEKDRELGRFRSSLEKELVCGKATSQRECSFKTFLTGGFGIVRCGGSRTCFVMPV